jgi:hypothetical protein
MAIVKFSVEVITLPVSDVDRALRLYVGPPELAAMSLSAKY